MDLLLCLLPYSDFEADKGCSNLCICRARRVQGQDGGHCRHRQAGGHRALQEAGGGGRCNQGSQRHSRRGGSVVVVSGGGGKRVMRGQGSQAN